MAERDNVGGFDKYSGYSEYSPYGRNWGGPMQNLLMYSMFGDNYAPKPQGAQSIYDAYQARERSKQFMQIQSQAFASNMLFQSAGLNASNPMMQFAGRALGSPDGMVGRMLSPLIGGNPMAAQMQLYAGMTGGLTMGAFGRTGNVSMQETNTLMQTLQNSFYKRTPMDQVRTQYDQEFRNMLDKDKAGSGQLIHALGLKGQDTSKLNISEFKDKIIGGFLDRGQQADHIETMISKHTDKLPKEIEKDLEDYVLKITGGVKAEFDKLKDDNGAVSLSKVKQYAQQVRTATGIDQIALNLDQYEKQGGKYAGVNFANTRGFQVEDFTSAYLKSADLRLMGRRDINENIKGLAEHGGRALDAARGVFGDKSGGELVQDISNLLGNKTADLSTDQGSREIENTLRKVKAVAKTAGMSIEAMLGIVDAAKEVASNHPELRYMSSSSTLDMTMKALTSVTAMGTVMNSQDYRQSGGSQQMAANTITEQQAALTSDLGGSIAALQYAFKGNKGNFEKVQKIMQQRAASGITSTDLPGLLDEISKATGTNVADLVNTMNNGALRQYAMGDEAVTNMTTKVMGAAVSKTLYDKTGITQGKGKEQMMAEYRQQLAQNPSLSMREFFSGQLKNDPLAMNYYQQYETTINTDFQRGLNPQAFSNIDTLVARQQRRDTEMSEKLAHRNAPALTQLASELAKGGPLDQSKLEALINPFVDSADKDAADKRAKLKKDYGGLFEAGDDAESMAKAVNSMWGLAEGKGHSAADLESMNKTMKSLGNKDAADRRLNALRKKKSLNESEGVHLKDLERAEKLGLLSSDKSYRKGASGISGIAEGIFAAGLTKTTNEDIKNYKDSTYQELNTLMQYQGKQAGPAGDVYRKALAEFGGSSEKMIEAATKGTGMFANATGERKGLQDKLKEYGEKIADFQEKSEAAMSDSPAEKAQDEMKALLTSIKEALNNGELTNSIKGLVTALGTDTLGSPIH